MKAYATYYEERCEQAAQDQGVTQLAAALTESGISATVQQTGGFTMAAYIELSGDTYIYANPYGAAVYDIEGYGADIAQYDTAQDPAVIVKVIEDYLAPYSCGLCGDIFTQDQGVISQDSKNHLSFICNNCKGAN